MFSPSAIAAYLLGVLTPVIIDFLTRGLGLRHQDLDARVNELCSLTLEQARRASEYWSLLPGDLRILALEAEIAGVDTYVGALMQHITEEFPQFETFLENDPLFEFSDAVAGGDFQVANRQAEPVRARLIYASAYQLCLALRRGRRATIFPPRLRWK